MARNHLRHFFKPVVANDKMLSVVTFTLHLFSLLASRDMVYGQVKSSFMCMRQLTPQYFVAKTFCSSVF